MIFAVFQTILNGSNGPKWFNMIQNGSIWFKNISRSLKILQILDRKLHPRAPAVRLVIFNYDAPLVHQFLNIVGSNTRTLL